MSIPLHARLVDLANLVIAKGSNFLLTLLLFALLSRGMDSPAFGEFGYWWSIALMIGGVLLGGLSSALVRVAAVHGSLRHLAVPLRRASVALLGLALLVTLALAILAPPEHADLALLLAAVALFGLAVQGQTAVLALLRAAEATRANAIASVLIVLLVPLALHLTLGSERALPWVFFLLAVAFAVGTLVALVCARRRLGHLLAPPAGAVPDVAGFLGNASSFTAVNVFSYAVVNVDFTLFRLIGTPADFALMATGKVFFERFVVPALMVFAGAVSLRVLRHPRVPGGVAARIEADVGPRTLGAMLALIGLLALAYWVFAHAVRGDATSIALPWVASAAAGYLLFALNGILFDVLVVRRSLTAVVAHVGVFLLLACAIQAVAIRSFGVPGWAIGWLLFNAAVLMVLAREGLRLRMVGWGTRPRDDDERENR